MKKDSLQNQFSCGLIFADLPIFRQTFENLPPQNLSHSPIRENTSTRVYCRSFFLARF